MLAPPPSHTARLVVVHHRSGSRAGLASLLSDAADLTVVGEAGATGHPTEHIIYACDPDAVILEDRGPHTHGLRACLDLKRYHARCKVLISAERADRDIIAASQLAGADGVVDWNMSAETIHSVVRRSLRGHPGLPTLSELDLAAVASALPAADHAILAMRLSGTPVEDVAATVQLDVPTAYERVAAMLDRLCPRRGADRSANGGPRN